MIDHTSNLFQLNCEQQRAFRIVANHSVMPSEQLKMYLGGMGGTGKSQVIKALKHYFEKKNESHRFVILGPTGTSAALLGGSTYHSFLGIRMQTNTGNHTQTIAQVRTRLEGIDYIFIDEVSMLSCHDLYKISSQLAKALNVIDLPFGGMNMIFAGDFAQLPPVGGASLYSGSVGTQVDSALKPHNQEAAIGKALWHQVTTVVILRENMRQKTQSPEDSALRTALVNMRYGACTPEDIKFLRKRIAGTRPDQPNVASKNFRNVAIICGVHSQKDRINQLGCERFAADTNQKLTNFYSVDNWGKDSDPAVKIKWGKSKSASKTNHKSSQIDFDEQREIWKLNHAATEHFPGKLSLCIGMPVMIRNNDATELCITKGQEGFVVGWQSTKGPHDKRALDTLFVKLDNPPQTIQIPDLPENVAPIVKSTKTISCQFPSDLKESVERQQVCILPNFAMTAHASQGKTRPYNVVHLNSCHSHMSYYTALSRSASAAGTIIIQGFDANMITRGCSGYLRQEFREQELLDDITRLKYEGQLPEHINGHLRNTLIRQYQTWKGTDYVPPKTDMALKWSSKDPLPLLPEVIDSTWQLINKSSNKRKNEDKKVVNVHFIPAKGSQPVTSQLKRKCQESSTEHLSKKNKITAGNENYSTNPLIGLHWDSNNWSCAYDSIFVILYNIWFENPATWTIRFQSVKNTYLSMLTEGFNIMQRDESISFENVRDAVRAKLHSKNPTEFPRGQSGTSVANLSMEILKPLSSVAYSQLVCSNCQYTGPEMDDRLNYVIHVDSSTESTLNCMQEIAVRVRNKCPHCNLQIMEQIQYSTLPNLLVLEYSASDIITSHEILVKVNDEVKTLYLKGVVYYGGYHFASRFISESGTAWYHDGITTGGILYEDKKIELISDTDMRRYNGKDQAFAIYAPR